MVSAAIRRVGVLIGLACLVTAADARSKSAPELSAWIKGPVLYIARKAETDKFKALDKDDERALFIERFWARRDPTPATLANEYRQLFWERVGEANERFLDSHKEGWKTDRGKIHVLYGPPTDVQEDTNLDSRGSRTDGRGVIRWIYQGRPDDNMAMDPVIVVPFVRETTGEYLISHEPELASVFWDPGSYSRRDSSQVDRLHESLGTPRRSELSVMLDLGRMQEIPTQAQVLLERVETFETYRSRPADVDVSQYTRRDGTGTTVIVTADVSESSAEFRPSIVARFTPHDAANPPRILGEDSFRFDEHDGGRVAQARLALDTGRYDVTVMVLDPVTAITGMYRTAVAVQPASSALRFSSVVRATLLTPLEYAGLASYDEPFHVGPFRVIPRIETDYPPGATIKLFYEVYGGEPPYRIAYQLEGREDDGSWIALGRPSEGVESGSSQGWELPTSPGWPPGDYRIRIDVEDAAPRLISTHVPFRLEAPGGADAE